MMAPTGHQYHTKQCVDHGLYDEMKTDDELAPTNNGIEQSGWGWRCGGVKSKDRFQDAKFGTWMGGPRRGQDRKK